MCEIKSCKDCPNGKKFNIDTIVSNQEMGDMFSHNSCGIVQKNLFMGVLLGIFEKTSNPVLFLQKRKEECYFNEEVDITLSPTAQKYTRYESKAYYHTLNKLCNIYRNHRKDDLSCIECKDLIKCHEQDALAVNFLMENFKVGMSVEKFQEICNLKIKELEPFVGREDGIYYLRYTCRILGYYELAFPVIFKGKLLGVLMSGQMKNDLYQDDGRIKNHLLQYNVNEENLKTTTEVEKVITDMIECLKELDKTLTTLTESKLKEYISITHLNAYEKLTGFTPQYNPNFFGEKYYNNLLQELNRRIAEAFRVICNELEISAITVFNKQKLSVIAEKKENVLKPTVYSKDGFKAKYLWADDIFSDNIEISETENCLRRDGEDVWLFLHKVSEKPNYDEMPPNINDFSLYAYGKKYSDFKMIILIDWNDACNTWRIDENIFNTLKNEFCNMLQGLADISFSFANEMQSSFYANQIISFTTSMRHEIGQQSAGMRTRFTQFDQHNAWLFNRIEYSLPNDLLEEHKDKLKKFSWDISDYVEDVTIRLTSSRYWNGIPDPNCRFFRPYREFFFKWNTIFRDKCDAKGLKLNFPRIESNDAMRPHMYAESIMIEQVAYNLTNNAIKYSYQNSVIDIDCLLSENKDFYELTVTNYGSLIPKEDKDIIYEYGKRGSNTRDFSGQGIGLYISRTIAEKHNGTLTHTSEKISNYNLPLIDRYLQINDAHTDVELKEQLKIEKQRFAGQWDKIVASKNFVRNLRWLKQHIGEAIAKTTFTFRIPNKFKGGKSDE